MYGLRVSGLPELADVAGALRPVAPDAPELHLSAVRAVTSLEGDHLDDTSMAHRMPLGAGEVRMSRVPLRADFTFRDPVDLRAVVHPAMARVGAAAARWLGRDCVHAGAFVVDGEAWGVLGAKGAGKSSLLAQLHLLGVPVLSDDVLVLERGSAVAGPGSVDLRRPAADALGIGELLPLPGPVEQTPEGPVQRERWRVALGPAPASARLRGWVLPVWSESASGLTTVPAAARVPLIVQNVPFRHPRADPEHFFDIAMRTSVVWSRPRDFSRSEASASRLLDLLAAL